MTFNLQENTLMLDGALGTQLQALAGKTIAVPEALNLDAEGRRLVERVHGEYIKAGAQVIETNTFAANFPRLERFGLGAEMEKINRAAVEVARQAAAGSALVAGSVGPLDLGISVGENEKTMYEKCFHDQVDILKSSGVDLLMLETFSSPSEARLALEAARAASLPVFFSIGGQSISRPYARKAVLEMIALAGEFKVDAFGVNCLSPYDLGQVLDILAANTSMPLLAYPNAGTPSIERGVVKYDLPLDALLQEARKWFQKGVVVFGGCCGTNPEHIRALAAEFKDKKPCIRPSKEVSSGRAGLPVRPSSTGGTTPGAWQARLFTTLGAWSRPAAVKDIAAGPANLVREKMNSGRRPLVAIEIKPVLSKPLQATVDSVEELASGAVDFFSVPDNPAANPARDCMACAALLQQKYRIPAIIHKTATQSNALHISSYLLGAHDLGIRGVLAVTGDPPGAGAFDRVATRVNDVRNSIELLRLISLLREGTLVNGQSLPFPVDFAAGCAFAHGDNMKSQLAWLDKKADAGAEFVFTQPVFCMEDFERVAEALGRFSLKKFIGILPVVSTRQAEFIRSGKIPGMTLPASFLETISAYKVVADQAIAGMGLALELAGEIAKDAEGIYVIMPFHKNAPALTAELIRSFKPESRDS
ncbi:MAG: homocysteine S-methyltransferase family protein [Kiritimatiellia bacterium]